MAEIAYNVIKEEISPEELKKAPPAAISVKNLIGKWNNCDRNTRGMIKLVLSAEGSTLKVQGFGACHPSPCDWGVVNGVAYAENVTAKEAIAFSAQYDFKFKSTIVTGYLDSGTLIVETFDLFKDGSGRSNYYSRVYLCRS